MVIVADSGGSKIDWRFLRKDSSIGQASSTGFNPYYQPLDHLNKIIDEILLPNIHDKVSKIFFYGTGVSSEKNVESIRSVFAEYFPDAATEVGWDLLAAARALCGREPGIACILGTGSNSCLYDGEKIIDNVANLGWILADEGSGTYMGKQIVFDYFRNEMPTKLAEQFHARFPWSREEVLEKVYQEEKPGAFLASFSKFIFQHVKEPYCYKLAYNSISDFFENNVMKYKDYKNLKVHLVGSIGFYFSDVVRQVANDKGVTLKNILESPIAGLTLYHQKDL
ncbi:MAG TPA: N-acetylglucosamine kinase [Cytophagales bacterium]|jgi:glucosamine kinase|nr:N-acetylglucosamine kinase [Cytophagales bacterium]